jgi:O-antigen/teichoic acid export membrane protein
VTRPPPSEPLDVDGVASVAIGTVLFLVAFLLLVLIRGVDRWAWVCLAGAGLGVLGLVYCLRRRAGITRRGPEEPTA